MAAMPGDDRLKDLIKTAIVELFQERRDLLQDLIEEALEDAGLARAIEEGETTELVRRDQVFKLLAD